MCIDQVVAKRISKRSDPNGEATLELLATPLWNSPLPPHLLHASNALELINILSSLDVPATSKAYHGKPTTDWRSVGQAGLLLPFQPLGSSHL